MTLDALRDDALRSSRDGFALLLGLPWIRSLPIASLADLVVSIDGDVVDGMAVAIDGREVAASDLAGEAGWWFLQDRLEIHGSVPLSRGTHDVSVAFRLIVPYLQTGPDGPLALPFHITRPLTLDAPPAAPSVAAVSAPRGEEPEVAVPPGWTLAASAFNWTPEVIRAERTASDIAVGIVAGGVARTIEIEPGQLWRSFPEPHDADVDALRGDLEAVGGSVSIVGASLDDWLPSGRRRTDEERLRFLLPQLHAAHRVGAAGVRLPIGQAGEPLLRQLLPVLDDLDLVLFEEIQGQQTPDAASTRGPIEAIAGIDDRHVRLLVDISMLMPSLPTSYLERLRAGGVPEELLQRLASEWRDPSTNSAVVGLLRSGGVPPDVQTTFMNLLVRFGRSDAADLRDVLPLVGAFHLKFWDLDDTDGRVSQPIRDLGAELAGTDFAGTLCSEWGGHEWIDADAAAMTRAHLELARTALAQGAAVASR